MTVEKKQSSFTTVEEAEATFYSAFEKGDIELINTVLADDGVCCTHPASLPIIGRDSVLESWREILVITSEYKIQTEVLSKSNSNNFAVHVVSEKLTEKNHLDLEFSHAIATNVYILQEDGWRLLTHHASFFKPESLF